MPLSEHNNVGDAFQTLCAEVLEIGARVDSGPSDRLVGIAFRQELEDQLGLSKALNLVDLAHTVVAVESGSVPADIGIRLIAGLLKLGSEPESFAPDSSFGDLYTNREAWLRERSYPADWLGAGRARREAITTAFHITVRESLLDLSDALILFTRALLAKARRHAGALMPDYTYLQAAQPTTFGHYLLGFAYPVLRDLERLQALFSRLNRSPAGCGSTNGSRIPQNRERLCELLGFEGLAVHARDAMWQADLPIETAALLTAILVNLDRLAEDLQIFTTEEFALVDVDDRHARASKIMPQKKNPFALTHIRGSANSIIGTLTASAAMGRTPSGQPDNRLRLYGMMPRALEDTRNAVELLAEVIEFLTFNEAPARTRLEKGFAMATELAEVLVLYAGLNFRQAHRLVGCLVREQRKECRFNQLSSEELTAASQRLLGWRIELGQDILRNALDPYAAVAARLNSGGAAPEAVSVMIAQCQGTLSKNSRWTTRRREKLKSAEQSLLQGVSGVQGLSNASSPSTKEPADQGCDSGVSASDQCPFPK